MKVKIGERNYRFSDDTRVYSREGEKYVTTFEVGSKEPKLDHDLQFEEVELPLLLEPFGVYLGQSFWDSCIEKAETKEEVKRIALKGFINKVHIYALDETSDFNLKLKDLSVNQIYEVKQYLKEKGIKWDIL